MLKNIAKKLSVLFGSVLLALLLVLGAACTDETADATFKLTFQTDGGTTIPPIEAAAGEDITPPADPSKEGFIFEGWYISPDFSGEKTQIPSVMPDHDVTYYAKWKEEEKTETTAEVMFNVGSGGTLSTTSVQVKAGSALSDAIKDKTPQPKEGLTFAGWFLKNGEIYSAVENQTVPAAGIMVYARYTTEISVNIYEQGTDGAYPAAPQTEKVIAYFDEAYTYETVPEHFSVDEEKDNKLTAEKVAAGETFTVYFARDTHLIAFDGNAPEGAVVTGEEDTVEAYYGATVTLPEGSYAISGAFRFGGWKATNDPKVMKAGSSFTVAEDVILYAYWNEGLTDIMGGRDIVYLLAEEENAAVLVRGGIEFTGTVKDGVAIFAIGDVTVEAHLFGDGFSYYHEEYADTFTYYNNYYMEEEPESRFDDRYLLELDGMGGAKYTYPENGVPTTVEAGYYVDLQAGCFYLSFVYQGQDDGFYFMLGLVGEEKTPAFILCDPEEVGVYSEFYVTSEDGYGTFTGASIILDGEGNALLTEPGTWGDTTTQGKYVPVKTYVNAAGDVSGVYKAEFGDELYIFQTFTLSSGRRAYTCRSENMTGEFKGKLGEEDATLVLDGFGTYVDSAQLTVGDEETQGSFDFRGTALALGGVVIDLVSADEETVYTLLVNKEEGTFTEIDYDFIEYMMIMDGDVYSPIVLFYNEAVELEDEEIEGFRAEVYVEDEEGGIVHAASGYYTVKNIGWTQFYSYTQLELSEGFAEGDVFTSFECLVMHISTADSTFIDGYYMISSDETDSYLDVLPEYRMKDGAPEETGNYLLRNIGSDPGFYGSGSLYVQIDGEELTLYVGSVEELEFETIEETVLEFVYGVGDGVINEFYATYFYYRPYEEEAEEEADEMPSSGTVIALDYSPYELNTIDTDGYVNSEYYALVLDGMGGAVWNVYEADDSGWWTEYVYVGSVSGTVTITGQTVIGGDIFTFVPEENDYGVETKEFVIEYYEDNFLGIVTPYYLLHEKYSEPAILTGDYGTLALDGFVSGAIYTNTDGVPFVGTYLYGETDDGIDENVIFFWFDDGVTYLTADVTENSFTVRDGMDGRYDIWNDAFVEYTAPLYNEAGEKSGTSRVVAILDGYGHIEIERYSDGVILAEGEYSVKGESIFELSVSWDGGSAEADFVLVSDGYDAYLVIKSEEHIKTLVTTKGEVIVFDGYGFADYYSEYGYLSAAQYTELSDGLWLILFEDSTSILIHEGDFGVANCREIDNTEYMATYYASDLSAVVFLKTVVQLDGVAYYYEVSEDGKTATLYSEDGSETEQMTMPVGNFVEYNKKTFYLWEEKELTFTSTDEFAPGITIKFTPDGTGDYTVPMFFMSEEWNGQFEMDASYNYLGNWSAQINYDNYSDWFYITLNYNFETGEGTFTFDFDMGGTLTTYTTEGSTLYVIDGTWGDVVNIITLKTNGKTVIAVTTNGLDGIKTEETNEDHGAVYSVKDGDTVYKFCLETTEDGKNVLYLL